MAVEFQIIPSDALTWDFPVYEVEITSGHPLRHELAEDNPLEAGIEYTWRARLKDGDDVWSCYSKESAVFSQSPGADAKCLSCSRIVNNAPLAAAKFGEQESDTSTITLKAGTAGATTIPVTIYRTTINADNTTTETTVGTFSLQYPSGAGSAFAMSYKLLNGYVHILYVSDYDSSSGTSEVIYCKISLAAPTVVADSMHVVVGDGTAKIRKELALVYLGGERFVGLLHADISSVDTAIKAYRLDLGVWSGMPYPGTYDPDGPPLPQAVVYGGFATLAPSIQDTVFAYKAEPGTMVVYAVQDRSSSKVVLYRFDLSTGAAVSVTYTNSHPATGGNYPVFVEFLPGDAVLRVLLAHYTPAVGAEILSLSFTKRNLDLVNAQIIPYFKQIADGDPQPHTATLIRAGDGYAMMTRTTLNEDYMEVEAFVYDQATGLLTGNEVCEMQAVTFSPAAAASGSSGLGLAIPPEYLFYNGTKIIAPVITEPANPYYTDGEFLRGSIIDLALDLPAMTHREYGEVIGSASGSALASVGQRGNPSNDSIVLAISSACTLTGLKVSATFDRSVNTVWASSAWIYIQELDYAFPLIMGDESYSPWPITVAELEVSLGSVFESVLAASSSLTFEVFQSGSVGTITYSSLEITAYTTPENIVDGTEACVAASVDFTVYEVGSLSADGVSIKEDSAGNLVVAVLANNSTNTKPNLLKFAPQLTTQTEAVDKVASYGPTDMDIDLSSGNILVLEKWQGDHVRLVKYSSALEYVGYVAVNGDSWDVAWPNKLVINQTTGDIYTLNLYSGSGDKFYLTRFNSSLAVQVHKGIERTGYNYTGVVGDLAVNHTTGDVYIAGHDYSATLGSNSIRLLRLSADLGTLYSYAISTASLNARYETVLIDQSTGDVYAFGSIGSSVPKLLVSKYNSSLVHQNSVFIDVGASTIGTTYPIVSTLDAAFLDSGDIAILFRNYDKQFGISELLVINKALTSFSTKSFDGNFGGTTRLLLNSVCVTQEGIAFYSGEVRNYLATDGWNGCCVFKSLELVPDGSVFSCYPDLLIADESYSFGSESFSPSTTTGYSFVTATSTPYTASVTSMTLGEIVAACGYT